MTEFKPHISTGNGSIPKGGGYLPKQFSGYKRVLFKFRLMLYERGYLEKWDNFWKTNNSFKSRFQKTISKVYEKSDKYWSMKRESWVQFTRIGPVYLYKFSGFNKKTTHQIMYERLEAFQVKHYPVIYTLAEIKEKYPNRWMIPTSPDLLVKHEGKFYKITELKQFYN